MRLAIILAAAVVLGCAFSVSQFLPASSMSSAQVATRVTIPAGTRILIRMVDSIDSKKQKTGTRFTGTLETNLQVDDVVVAKRGSTVYGRLITAKSAGNTKGSSQLTLELTDLVIEGTAHPLVTSSVEFKGGSQSGKTARRVVGGAGLGAAVGAIAGGGKGTAIGATAGATAGTIAATATSGEQLLIPSQSLLEFRLQQPASLPVPK